MERLERDELNERNNRHKHGTLMALQNAVSALLREAPERHNVRAALADLDEATRVAIGRQEDAIGHSADPLLEGYAASMQMFWNALGGPD